jgi:amidase
MSGVDQKILRRSHRFSSFPSYYFAVVSSPDSIMLSRSLLAAINIAFSLLPVSIAHNQSSYNASQLVESQTLKSPYPYDFPLLKNGLLADNGQFPMPLCHGFKLEEATIDQLQQELSGGRLTSVQIAFCYLQRIYHTDEYIR